MRNLTARTALFALTVFFGTSLPVFATEPWADEKLRVTEGLEVWLDAVQQNTARRALQKTHTPWPAELMRAPRDKVARAQLSRRHAAAPLRGIAEKRHAPRRAEVSRFAPRL